MTGAGRAGCLMRASIASYRTVRIRCSRRDPGSGVARRRASRRVERVKPLPPLIISGKEVLPLVEGGKGISVSNGESSGAWAAAGGVGTFSGVNADSYDPDGKLIEQVYRGRTRRERHEELVAYAIQGGIHQAQIAHESSNGQGRIHMN